MVNVEAIATETGEDFLAALLPLQVLVTDWYHKLDKYSDDDVAAVFRLDLERVDEAIARQATLADARSAGRFLARIEAACGAPANEAPDASRMRLSVAMDAVKMTKPSVLALDLAFADVLRDPAYRVTARTIFVTLEAAQKRVATLHKIMRGDPVIGVRKKLESTAAYRLEKQGEADLKAATARLTQRFCERPSLLPFRNSDPQPD